MRSMYDPNIIPSEFLAFLEDFGFAFTVRDGKLLAHPVDQLTAREKELLKVYKAELIELVSEREAWQRRCLKTFGFVPKRVGTDWLKTPFDEGCEDLGLWIKSPVVVSGKREVKMYRQELPSLFDEGKSDVA